MDIYFSSAEQPQYLDQLIDLGVTHIAISYYEWIRRHSNDRLPSGVEVLITPGISKKTSIDFTEYAQGFCEFAELHADRALIFDVDSVEVPSTIRREIRTHLNMLPNVVMFPTEDETIDQLAAKYERVGVNSRLAKSLTPNELRRAQASLYGSNVLDMATLRTGRFVATTTMAWLSPRRYGELWVFTGGKMRHYSAEKLQRAVRAHRGTIEAFGLDPEACSANHHPTLTALAVKSMLAMAQNLARRPRDRKAAAASAEVPSDEVGQDQPNTGAIRVPNLSLVPHKPREKTVLPVISMKEEISGRKVISAPQSARRCDSCNLSGSCPKYEPGSDCAFDIPVEIKTRAQWEAASQVLLETQFSRAMFAHFVDETDGGIPSKATGAEIDRFFKVLTQVKELEQIDPPEPGSGAIAKALAGLETQGGPTQEKPGQESHEDDVEDAEVIYEEDGPSGDVDIGYANQEASAYIDD